MEIMASLETQRNNEELADIQALTKPDDVSDKLLVDTTIPPLKVFSQEMALGFIDHIGSDKQATESLNKLPKDNDVKVMAEKYETLGLRPAVAVRQAEAMRDIKKLSDEGKKFVQESLSDGYLPTTALAQWMIKEKDQKEDKLEITAEVLNQKADSYGRSLDKKDNKRYARDDARYNVPDGESASDTLKALEIQQRVHDLGKQYNDNGALISMISSMRNGVPLTGNEFDLRKSMDPKDIHFLLLYAKKAYYNGGIDVSEEDIKELTEDLEVLDSIYDLAGDHRNAVMKQLDGGLLPRDALNAAANETVIKSVDPKFMKKKEKIGYSKQDIINEIRTGFMG